MEDHNSIVAALQAAGWKQRTLGGFIDTAGPLWTRKEGAGFAYGILVEERHLNPGAIVHGGMLGTLMDHAISTVAWEAAGRQRCVTLQLDTHFLAPARTGDFVEARGAVMHRTNSTLFMQGHLSVAGQPVASAQAIMRVVLIQS